MNIIHLRGRVMNKKKNILAWIMLIMWMVLIFYMSNQNGEVSSGQSDLIIKVFQALGIELNNYFGDLATFIVRKGAHLTEYLILFLLSYRVIIIYVGKKNARIYALALVFLYACTDEIHQYFVPGRAMAIKDVMIDTCGGFIGLVSTIIYGKIKGK